MKNGNVTFNNRAGIVLALFYGEREMIPQNDCIVTPCEGYLSPDMGLVGQVVNLYVQDVPMTPTERLAYSELVKQLPPPMQHGVRPRVWRFWYPDISYPGLTVGMRDITVVASSEVLIPYEDFQMENVPWDKI